VTKAAFTFPVADLDRGPRTLTFTLDEAWLSRALEGTDATPRAAGSATVELSKSGRQILVRGSAQAPLSMPCVVTLDPVDIEVNPEIFLMLAPAEAEAPASTGKKSRRADGKAEPAEGREARATPTKRRGSKDELEEDELLDDNVAARDTFSGSQIELDPFFREFLVLELPMFPRRSDLPLTEGPAIGPPSSESAGQEPAIDPRLQPLAALRSRLRESKE
jgi:uncharacterized metal-binding protein YceD (DUF177 family)